MTDVTASIAEKWVINRYLRMHEMAFDGRHPDMVIPFKVMRDYIDAAAAIRSRRTVNGGTITISNQSRWLNQFPPLQRKDIVSMIFGNAAEFGWDIRMEGSKWT